MRKRRLGKSVGPRALAYDPKKVGFVEKYLSVFL